VRTSAVEIRKRIAQYYRYRCGLHVVQRRHHSRSVENCVPNGPRFLHCQEKRASEPAQPRIGNRRTRYPWSSTMMIAPLASSLSQSLITRNSLGFTVAGV
jgi:hypothetical protein